MTNTTLTLFAATSALLLPFTATAQTVVYSEDFTGFTSGVNFFAGVGVYTFGFDGETEAIFDANPAEGNNVKPLNSGEWAKSGALNTAFGFNDRGGNIVAQPSAIGVNASKGMGVFLDASVFTPGTGTYTLTIDIIGDGGDERNARLWIGTSSSHQRALTDGWGLDVSDVKLVDDELGSPWLLTGSSIVTEVVTENLITATDSTVTVEFDYVAGEDVGIAFASANSDVAFDNLVITSLPSDGGNNGGDNGGNGNQDGTWAGFTIENGLVNTRDFMGWLDVSEAPWIYSFTLEGWLYLPEANVTDNGAWTFVMR